MNPLHIIGGLLLAGAIAGGALAVRSYNTAIKENARLQRDLDHAKAEKAAADAARDAAEKEKDRLQALLDLADELAKRAAKEAEDERKRNEKLAGDLRELAKRDKAVKDWADTAVPDSVRKLRRGTGADYQDGVRGTPGLPDLNGSPQSNPGAAPERRNQWRLGSRIEGEPLCSAVLQFGQSGCQNGNRKEPEMKTMALVYAALILNAVIPDAAAQEKPVQVVAPETNFYEAIAQIAGPGADAETKRMGIFAATMAHMKDKGGNGSGQQQVPQIIQAKAGRTFWDVLVEGADRVFSSAERIAPAVLSYAASREGSRANVRLGEVNAALGARQSDNFLALGQAGIAGTSNTAIAGFQTIGGLSPSNTYTISGNANFGSGPLTITRDSWNRNCVGGSAAPGGASQGTTGTVSGGAGAAGGPASC